jgi:hypothetical protein
MFTRHDSLVAHLVGFAKGYANERTLATFMAKFDAGLDAHGLRGNLEVVTLPNGRLQPVLVFGPRETVITEAILMAHGGMPLFQYRPDGR